MRSMAEKARSFVAETMETVVSETANKLPE